MSLVFVRLFSRSRRFFFTALLVAVGVLALWSFRSDLAAQSSATLFLPLTYRAYGPPLAPSAYLPVVYRNLSTYDWPNVQGELLAVALTRITDVTHAGDGSGRLFITEQPGTVRIYQNNSLLMIPFLDIQDLVGSTEYEQGLFSIAFPPDFETKRHFYVSYTDLGGDSRVTRYRVSDHNPNLADPASGEEILLVEQPGVTHNGGQLQFGPDGYLGMGDGDNPDDPYENAQNLSVLLGKILRIDVESTPGPGYQIPPDNPFVHVPGARPELWAYGLRNPWRFTFDRATGEMFIGDVGQNVWEEINHQPPGSSGLNYGWDCYEGRQPFEPEGCGDASQYTFPLLTYSHAEGCAVTAGYVYRGVTHPRMQGLLYYADFCSGALFAVARTSEFGWWRHRMVWARGGITTFGEDEAGTLYVGTRSGRLYRLVDIPPP